MSNTTLHSAQLLDAKSVLSGMAPLGQLGVIRVTGDDAVTFLQGQLTQDVAQLGAGNARLAAFCNAKGRMQASFVIFRRGDDILMVCSRDILAATLKRLSMFVMRAKAKLVDASDDYLLAGLAGDAIKTIADGAIPAWHQASSGTAALISLYPGAEQSRALWCAPAGTPLPEVQELDIAVWNWLEVQSGIAMITQPLYEAFVPQMLNYESVGGVSFKKGCYPGQEVVARSQFRGTLKRRAYLVHGDAAAAIGQEVFHLSDPGQPCGTVAAAAPSPFGGFDAIVSMQVSAAADAGGAQLRLGAADGPALDLLPLPYPLLEDI
jgi:tRNA-modifying protein YgfZ